MDHVQHSLSLSFYLPSYAELALQQQDAFRVSVLAQLEDFRHGVLSRRHCTTMVDASSSTGVIYTGILASHWIWP